MKRILTWDFSGMAFWTINHPRGGLWNIFSFLCKLLILARIFHFRGFWVLLEGGILWFVTKMGLFLSSTWSLNCPIGGLWKKYHYNWDRLVLGNLKAAIAQNWFMYACFLDISHAKRSITAPTLTLIYTFCLKNKYGHYLKIILEVKYFL